MKAESLIFDIDGTLWDTRAVLAEGYNLQLTAEGRGELLVSPEELRSLFGMVDRDIADRLFPGLPAAERYDLMRRCMASGGRLLRQRGCPGYPGVVETLRVLAKSHRLFIVSNSEEGYPEQCLAALGVQDLFQGTLCYGQTRTSKGRTIRTLIARYGIRGAAYIGDTQLDLEAAREAGIPFIWAAYGFGAPAEFDGKIGKFEDLIPLLK